MENVEDMESESGGLDYLDVPEVTGELLLPVLVLRKIFENLSSADLLNLSLVNKDWHYEARSVLRDRGSLTAKLNTDDGKCKDLRAFAADLRRMREVRNVVPFSGLTIAISAANAYHGDWCEESYSGELDQVYEDIVHQMDWKHLALSLSRCRDRRKKCAGFQLVKEILHNCSCVLEEFSLKLYYDHEAFIQHFLQECNFSRLKTLKFKGQGRGYGGNEDLIKPLVARAPKLKVLYTEGPVDLRVDLLEESAAVHVYDFPYSVLGYADIPEKIVRQLRLRQIRIPLPLVHQDFNYERFYGSVPVVLQKSHKTLISMQVDAVLLMGLMHYGICLENVLDLTVTFRGFDTLQPRSWGLLKSSDFNCIFPNLCSVRISYSRHSLPNLEHAWNAVIDRVEQGNAALIEPVNRSVNIKQLHLDKFPDNRDVRFLVEVFPHIEKIFSDAIGAPFFRFWDYWLDLDELDIRLRLFAEDVENFDSAFCGIFPEEVAELRERDEEYLQKVNIVPVMPSLACLKRLKSLRLFFDGVGFTSLVDPTSTDVTRVLSKVTGLVAFKRRPDLTVTVETASNRLERALQHMKPYASVRLTRPCRI